MAVRSVRQSEKKNAFCIPEKLAFDLREFNPDSKEEFFEGLYQSGGHQLIQGLSFSRDRIAFSGFPENGEKEEIKAWHMLAEQMLTASKRQSWAKNHTDSKRNEKYAFRMWLMSIGMKEQQFAEARRIMLSGMEGCSSFRTREQA